MENKHAYLIMAHGSLTQLEFLFSLLDDVRNDIYVHIDKKSDAGNSIIAKLKQSVTKSNLFFVPRVTVYWGGYSQIAAEMSLFKEAYKNGGYKFYHLLSGQDLPLQSQEFIHNFFDSQEGKIFLTMMTLDGDKENINRMKYYHFFESITPRTLPGILGKGIFKVYRELEVLFQKILRINRYKKENFKPIKAANWGSFPNYVIKLLVDNETEIIKKFKYSFLGDEVFIPYMLEKENLLGNLYYSGISYDKKEDFQGNLRYINWWDGNPYTWTDKEKDILALENARELGYLFSRKFDVVNKNNKVKENIVIWNNKIK